MKITKRQLRRIIREAVLEEKKKGLWANIHAKRKRGEKPAKKGDKDYPDEKAWQAASEADEIDEEVLDESENLDEEEGCWDGYSPGAITGVKTKKSPTKPGKRVNNCEKIGGKKK